MQEYFAGGRPQLGPCLCTNGWCAVQRVHQSVHRLQLPQTALQVLQSLQAPLLVWPPDLVCTRGGSTETRGAAGSAMPRIVVWCIQAGENPLSQKKEFFNLELFAAKRFDGSS